MGHSQSLGKGFFVSTRTRASLSFFIINAFINIYYIFGRLTHLRHCLQ